MQFTVEDGTGLSNATSYVDVAFADTYIGFYFPSSDWSTLTVAEKELRLIQATNYVDGLLAWVSEIKKTTQALSFPRVQFEDNQGRVVEDGSVPDKIKNAVAITAHISIDADIYDDGVLLKSERYGNSQDQYAVGMRIGGSTELKNLRKELTRAGYGRLGTSIGMVYRS